MWRRRLIWACVGVGVILGGAWTITFLRELGRNGEHLPPIDRNDPFAVGLRDAHIDLNSAVGWDDWRPRHIRDTAPRLRALAQRFPNAESPLIDAATHIERALQDNDRYQAVIAHRAVAGLESLYRQQKRARVSPSSPGVPVKDVHGREP
jgi:hypothetical protein